ncbi:extensin family protein [Rhizobium sp. RU36D]|uniref:extensin-like domain-containing protein n=1 Tax=Rhizobium sp. RU36D TaxID=1907415 RepID=UPI0009D84EBA|nr:extensin family protein [Rhizobium sp. RU36D]SMC62600.1 Uncharacterized conserved protein [Rhizobium sp. RU36D]
MAWKTLLAVTAAALSISAGLPDKGPLPSPKPVESQEQAEPPKSTETPVPGPKPDSEAKPDKAEDTADPEGKPAPASTEDKPGGTSPPDAPEASQDKGTKAEPVEPPLTIAPEAEAEFKVCMADLKAIGTNFETIDRVDDGDGCGIDKPIHVERVLPDVALSPAGDMRCQTALQLARWVKQTVMPAAEAGLPGKAKLTSVNHASTYVCRKRNGASEGKISEHARGNAVDIASLSFGQETVPMRIVKPEDSTIEDAFQRAINATACLYFTTVLSPGSDPTHQDHMHLDVLTRTGGFRYCR